MIDITKFDGHTPGPWRWEFNGKHRSVCVVGGRPLYDLSVMHFARWGMGGATPVFRDVAEHGMNIMHRLNCRPDWVAPLEGRKHHASWCSAVVHPDAALIAAAPDLLAEVIRLRRRERACATMDEAEKTALIRCLQGCLEALGMPDSASPADLVAEVIRLQAEVAAMAEQRDCALGMLACWCVDVDRNGTGWDDWDENYKDAMYRPGPLRKELDAAIAAEVANRGGAA